MLETIEEMEKAVYEANVTGGLVEEIEFDYKLSELDAIFNQKSAEAHCRLSRL